MTPVNDFTFYWYAAQQFVCGQNPYLAAPGREYVLFAPPWALAVLFPLGWLPLQVAQFVWLFALAILVFVSASWLWESYGEGRSPLIAFGLIAAFTPIWATFLLGQTATLVLFGIAGFLRYETKRPYVAGAFLFLVAFKPQLGFLVWPALLLCALFENRWKNLVGFAAALISASLLVISVRPAIFADYKTMLMTHRVAFYESSTLGTILRHASPGYAWMQFLPMVAGLAWFAWRWKIHHLCWEWKRELPGLLLVSLATTCYAWFADQLILVPAIFSVAASARKFGTRWLILVNYLVLNAAGLTLAWTHQWTHQSLWIACIPLLWLLLYGMSIGPFNSASVPTTSNQKAVR